VLVVIWREVSGGCRV